MVGLLPLLILPAQIDTVDSPDFSKDLQTSAITATVRVVNRSQNADGSGVLVGKKGPFVYVLTAAHVVEKAERLEVTVFTAASYPRPSKTYRSVRVVARTDDMRDLALLRLVTEDRLPAPLPLCPARRAPAEGKFKALLVGCAGGRPPTGQVEEVNGKKRVRRGDEGKAADCWEVDHEQPGGCSGGPMVDDHGFVLGVCSGTSGAKSYFCHLGEVRAFLAANGFDWLL